MLKNFKIRAGLLLFVLITPALAAPITWESATDTANPDAVVTTGALLEAINASAATGLVTVNGVTFSHSDTLLPNGAASVALSGQRTLDPGLDEVLNTVDYGGGTSTSVSVGGGSLVIGQSYLIQIFFTDLRSCCTGRVMNYGDGLNNTVDVTASGVAGTYGQNAVGSFVADGTNQTLSISTNNAGNVHLNAYQIRSAFSLPVIESFIAAPSMIAGGESSTLMWQISDTESAEIDAGVGGINTTMGSVSVSPTGTTSYTLTATNGGGSVSAQVTIGVDVVLLDPVLSEFLASNDASLADEDGVFSDWIEIYNPNVFEIDLAGYFLTDDVSNLSQWAFPARTNVAGKSHLIVFASGVSRGAPELHANFKISASAGSLALVAPDGTTVIDEFVKYPSQRGDISYGVEGYFSPPSPGVENGAAFVGFVADTSFDVDRGFFEDPFTVNIGSSTLGATIVYTTDGSEPTLTNGTAVSPLNGAAPSAASVLINGTTVLRAAAFKDGRVPTNVDTQTYLFAADIIEQAQMDSEVVDSPDYSAEMISAMKSVRSLSIVTDPDNLFSNATGILANTGGRGITWERPISIEFIDPDHPRDSFQSGAGLRMHGNGSRGSSKNSLRLLFRADYGAKKLDYPLFGEDWVAQKFNTIVLRAQAANSWTSSRAEDRASATYLQDTFAKDTQGAMGHPTAGSTFVHLFLNGTYWGLYNPTERPDGSFGEDHFGGDDTDYDAVNRRFSVEVLSGTKTHWDEMITHSNTLLDSQVEYEQLDDYIDIDNLIDYMLVHQFMQTRDGPDDFGHNNMRLVRRNNPSGPWRAYAWDMEYSMIDTAGTRDYTYPFPIYSSPRSGNRDITDSIASVYLRLKDNNPEFQLRYADRAYRHLYHGGALSEQGAAARFESRAYEIESAVVAESARWGDHRRTAPYTRDGEWTSERNRLLTEFFPARPDHVVGQLRNNGLYPGIDPPVFSQHGGEVSAGFEVTLSASTGTIYYTVDGTDPREAWTENILGSAYTLPIDLPYSMTVKARSLNNGAWSALTEASFLVGPLADVTNLVISEIFYNPVGPTEALEFIELENISNNSIELGDVSFTAGIDFTFAAKTRLVAGARILLVRDRMAFEAEYGFGLPIVGEFQNETGLSNSGEQLTLLAADKTIIRDFSFNHLLPWPTAADGQGRSLVLVQASILPDHSLPESWRSSTQIGGNPASGDAILFTGTEGADEDGNGVDDFLDYALGKGTQSALTADVDGSGSVTISYTQVLAADEVTLRVEWCDDLLGWSPLGEAFVLTSLAPIGEDYEKLTFSSVPETFNLANRAFFRLVAE